MRWCSSGPPLWRPLVFRSAGARLSSSFSFVGRRVESGVGGSSALSDKTITCRDCGQHFTFTSGEQAFYQERGYTEPQRCSSCRAARKAQRGDSGGYSSGGYSSGNYGGGYSGGGGGGGYSGGSRQMFPAVCSGCGKETEVPFQPTAGKPVYCRECFQKRGSRTPPRRSPAYLD